eukprot:TRINITY_DN8249_c0_g1_i6.p1 TRINITY_DN8249_c0_g1~~TRINITY_DN8249_c0_g1_i6.p1  ORF type:complete len:299 (+),score=134.03 TRINITY_DN8249_c0_g1_i6:35-931(+)
MAESRVPMTMRDFFFDDPFFKSSWEDFDRLRDKMFAESRDMWKKFDQDFRQMACMTHNIDLKEDAMAKKVEDKSSTFNASKQSTMANKVEDKSLSFNASNQSTMAKKVEEDKSSTFNASKLNTMAKKVEGKTSTLTASKQSAMEKKVDEIKTSNSTATNGLERQNSLAKYENGWMFPRRWMLPSLKSELRDMDLFKEKDSEVIRVKEDEKKMEVSLDTSQYRPDELKVSIAGGAVTVEGRHEEKAEDGSRMVSRQFVRKYSLPQATRPEQVTSNLSSDGVLVITAPKSNPAIEVKINQ